LRIFWGRVISVCGYTLEKLADLNVKHLGNFDQMLYVEMFVVEPLFGHGNGTDRSMADGYGECELSNVFLFSVALDIFTYTAVYVTHFLLGDIAFPHYPHLPIGKLTISIGVVENDIN